MDNKKNAQNELSQVEQTYAQIAGSKAQKTKVPTSTVLICIACGLLLVGILVGIWFLFSDNWLTMKDVTVGGINMNGMTKREAKDALTQMVEDRFQKEPLVITVQDTTVEFAPRDSDIQVDVNAAINDAYGKTGVFDLTPYITLDEEALNSVLETFGQLFNTNLVPTTYTVEGTMPDLEGENPAEAEGQTLVVQLGTPDLGLDTQTLRKQVMGGYSDGTLKVQGDFTIIEPEMPTPDSLFETYLTAPQDAALDETAYTITPEKLGYGVDKEAAAAALADAQYGDLLRIPFAVVVPEVTEESLMKTLFPDVLGECSTPYSGSDNNNRNTNLGLACEKIDGTILGPGQTFSYNKTLGERTPAAGWKPAATYVNGLTVDTYGGGICQGSSTLYNCVLQADLPITECYPHGYISSYIDPGLDASVNWPSADFKFTNNTDHPMYIEAYRRDGKMTMRLLGIDEKDYYVKMTYKVVGTRAYDTVYQEVDPDNNPNKYKDGQVLVTPYTGYTVKTYKNRYEKGTDKLIETKLERNFTYSHRDKVIIKLVSPTAPPTEPTPGTGGEGTGGSTGEGGGTPAPTPTPGGEGDGTGTATP